HHDSHVRPAADHRQSWRTPSRAAQAQRLCGPPSGVARYLTGSAGATRSRDKVHYFYASGKRVPLEVESSVWALDTEALAAAMIADAVRERILADARRLRGKYVLARVPGAVLDSLRAAHAVQLVYRSADAMLVALPEVRVEESRPEKLRRLRDWL